MSLPRQAAKWLLCCLPLSVALPAAAIVGGTDTQGFGQLSNGVQITENWVLTARHVGIKVGDTFADGYGSAMVGARYELGAGPTLVNDLALLRLTTPIALPVPALSLLSDLLPVGPLASPLAVTIATGRNQTPRGYGQTQIAEVIDKIQLDVGGTVGTYPVNWLVTYDAQHGAPYVQGGDSGGGLFLGHVTDSAGAALMGITSAQVQFDEAGGGGFGSAFVQLAAYRSWIDDTMRLDLTDSQTVRWVSAVPEPASMSMWLAGLLVAGGMGARRRKSTRAR
jgi:hypothetical protein